MLYHYRTTAYDGTNHVIKVTAVDDGQGNITCTMTDNDEIVDTEGQDVPTANPLFTNDSSEDDEHRRFERDDDDAEATPEAKKVLMGADGKPEALVAGQFSFELVQLSDVITMPDGTQVVVTDQEQPVIGPDGSAIVVTNDADGKVVFPTMYYGMGDIYHTFTYGIREVIPEGAEQQEDGTYVLDGITYDTSTKVFVVEVGWNPETKKVTSSTHYADAEGNELENATFTNKKAEEGAQYLPAPSPQDAQWRDAQGQAVHLHAHRSVARMRGQRHRGQGGAMPKIAKDGKVTVKNDGRKIKFPTHQLHRRDDGNTYEYAITEVKDNQSGITYDTTTLTYTVKIEENGTPGGNGDVGRKGS